MDEFSPPVTRSRAALRQNTAGMPADRHEETANPEPRTDQTQPDDEPNLAASRKRARMDFMSRSSPSGAITSFVTMFNGPTPLHQNVYRMCLNSEMDIIAKAVYCEALNVLYPDLQYDHAGIISEDHFICVVRYLFRARIDFVYGNVSGRRVEHRIALPNGFILPKAIADCINVYGTITIHSHSLLVIPKPPVWEEDATTRIYSIVTHVMLDKFSRFVSLCSQRCVFNTSIISRVNNGTAAWLLTVRETMNRMTIGIETSHNVQVWSQFPEWTPADGIMAALIMNRCNGYIFQNCDDLYFAMDPINDIVSLRNHFAINA